MSLEHWPIAVSEREAGVPHGAPWRNRGRGGVNSQSTTYYLCLKLPEGGVVGLQAQLISPRSQVLNYYLGGTWE